MIELYSSSLQEEFMSLAHSMHQESSFKDISFDPNKVANLLQRPDVFCAMYKKDDKYIGFMLAALCPYFFSSVECLASDLALFVLPEERGGFAAVRLIKSYEEWAKLKGATEIYLGQSTGIHIEKTDALYTRLGYTKLGSNMKKRI